MGVKLLALGTRPPGLGPNTHAMDQVDSTIHRLGALVTARCRDAADLVRFVAHHGRGAGLVDTLDVYDHGGLGKQRLGSEILFESSDDRCDRMVGWQTAEALDPHLSAVAQVRLLGCVTAGDGLARGRLLLIKLARELGASRVVFGTLAKIDATHFTEAGFRPELEKSFLFSSLAALDGSAPSREERRAHIKEVSSKGCP